MSNPRIVVLAIFLAMTLGAGAAFAGGGSTMTQAQAAGWDCSPQVQILGYYHCAPPGGTSVAALIAGTDVPTIVLRVFHPDGRFAGIETLRRADLYAGQPCPQDNLATWALLPFGYYACHRFAT